ncbi:YceI family protein [Pseudorhodoferax sp.]|uniref:YceI family protein n=1 Tax=Pseudorhodoferax sp. TaxID=1993553 RepID=UPI0039E22C42
MQRSALTALAAALLAAGSAHAQSATYAIDPTHTFATFEIDHFGAAVNRGRFEKKEGRITLDKAARTGKAEITFQIASLTTGVAPFDKHLQSAEIFDAAQFPTATFVGDRFAWNGDKVTEVAGVLTIKGKSQPVTFKARQFNCYESPMLKREVCGGDFEATIDRSAFGVDYGLAYGFPKNVRIVAQIEAVRQ